MKLKFSPIVVAFFFTLAPLHCYSSDSVPKESAPGYLDLLLEDTQYILTAPNRWESADWKNAGWVALAVTGTAALIDQPLRESMQRLPTGNPFMLTIEKFGAEYSLGVVGGFYVAGSLTGNNKTTQVAEDTLTASIIASGIITPALKIATGRSRPYENLGHTNFQGLGANKLNSSFPSGHTTEAFALASVISAHYDESWINYSVYTTATLVGIARIYNDAHFASDVVAGAIIGHWVGSNVVTHRQNLYAQSYILLPNISQDAAGLTLLGTY